MGLLSFLGTGTATNNWYATENCDARQISSGEKISIGAQFPTLKISKTGEQAEVFHIGTNTWSSTTVEYALMNGHHWPSNLLEMPPIAEKLRELEKRGLSPVFAEEAKFFDRQLQTNSEAKTSPDTPPIQPRAKAA